MRIFDLFLSFSFLRLVSLVGTILYFLVMSPYEIGPRPLLSGNTFVFIIWLTGVVHFVLGIAYALAAIDVKRFNKSNAIPLAAVIGGGASMYFAGVSPNLMQAYHHAASEGYTKRTFGGNLNVNSLDRIQNATFWTHLFLFFFLARGAFQWADLVDQYLSYWFLDVKFLGVGLAASYAYYFKVLYESRAQLTKRELLEFSAGELILLVAIAYSFERSFSTLELAVYHRFFWTLYPAALLLKRSLKQFYIYWALTAGLTAALYLISDNPWIKQNFVNIYVITGISHIILSVPFSHANPKAVKRFLGEADSNPSKDDKKVRLTSSSKNAV